MTLYNYYSPISVATDLATPDSEPKANQSGTPTPPANPPSHAGTAVLQLSLGYNRIVNAMSIHLADLTTPDSEPLVLQTGTPTAPASPPSYTGIYYGMHICIKLSTAASSSSFVLKIQGRCLGVPWRTWIQFGLQGFKRVAGTMRGSCPMQMTFWPFISETLSPPGVQGEVKPATRTRFVNHE